VCIDTGHTEFLHDIAYDFYGRRLATCSSDTKDAIRIFRQVPSADGNGSIWEEEPNGRLEHGHTCPVNKLGWAHPEFGAMIASCSDDQKVIIWKEEVGSGGNEMKWERKADLVGARRPVLDVKFAPHHMGLKLALCSKDGFVRIYEAQDVMKPNHWSPVHEFEAGHRGAEVTCLSWNPSRFDTPMLLVGTDGTNPESESTIKVWSFNEDHRKWQPLPWDELKGVDATKNTVYDVSWAPNVGRKYHLLACCSGDGTKELRIWKIPGGDRMFKQTDPERDCVVCEHEAGQAKRVSWNMTGTILASSGDDGKAKHPIA